MDHRRKSPIPRAEACTEASVLLRLDGTIGSWSPEARRMFGHSPEQVVGLPFSSLFTADGWDGVDVLARAAQSAPRHLLATAVDRDGTHFDAEVTSTRTLGVRDGGVGLVELVRDVTAPRAIEACLVACSGYGDTAALMAGLAEALDPWVPQAQLTLRVRAENGAAAAHKPDVVQLPLVDDGLVFATLNVAFPDATMAPPRVVRLLGAVADAIGPAMSRALELEEKSRTIGRLKRLDRLEKEFLALITHDMRTPLAVIAGFATSLREEWHELPDHERLERIDAILRNGESLSRLVEQDLELALIDSGQLGCELVPFDLAAQIERIVDDFECTAEAQFEVRVANPLSLVLGDEHRNWQVLANLLSNAVKYSPPRTLIEVDVGERGAMAHVTVRDCGPGISSGDAHKIFRKFARVGGDDARRVKGTGLGLYLARRLVESQGGRIWVVSELGCGSAFTYTLPLANGRLPVAAAAARH
jgi:PAS domain S-box-containing protein